MKILVIGSGGREHALAWKCAQSTLADEVVVAPGNAGTALEPGVRNVDVSAEDIDGLLALAQSEGIGLTIVGPEAPLVAGIVDRFTDAGLPCFGPSAAAAQLEGSKAFTKDFLARHDIPIRHISAEEWKHGQRGFIGHEAIDWREKDPGPDFPWETFLALVAEMSGRPVER